MDATTTRHSIERLARVGFAVKGVLYLLLGGSALLFALGRGGELTDMRGVERFLLNTAYGGPLLAVVGVGLGLYAAWRFLEAFGDANSKGRSPAGVGARALYALSGSVYGLLAVDALRLALGTGQGSAGAADIPRTLVAGDLAVWGALLVAAGLIAYGVQQLLRAFGPTLSDRLNLRRVQREIGEWPIRVSRVGLAGRGVVLMLMGVLLAQQARRSAAAAAQTDTGDTLRLLAALPTGEWLLIAVAIGLMAYGVFQLVQARYRSMTPP
jgi:hypothetical protein